MNMRTIIRSIVLATALSQLTAQGQTPETRINVDAAQILHPVSRYLTGNCIEDVNHEVYGGIYSQMLFGESFQEPPSPDQIKNYLEDGPTRGNVSGMWRPWRTDTARGEFSLENQ